MPSISAPVSKQTTTLSVVVKCRPLTVKERKRSRDIVRVIDDKEVIVLDPDLSKDYLDRVQNRTKEKKYCFDYAFGPDSTNLDVYKKCISSKIAGVIQGLNATVFAYGSTGSGKTYTMVGTQHDPGLMVLSLHTIFDLIKQDSSSDDFDVTCSYLEVYNEVIYDLLEKSSGHLELREDPEQGTIVAGIRCIKVYSADKILELLNLGNSRRKTEIQYLILGSHIRSHAVLEIMVKRKQKNQYRNQVIRGKLSLVDLAGSERASETNSGGQKLRDGANINRSLLALANCINALVMIATVSPADNQYHHTVNTLKYADRAKEIKTHIQKNIGTVDTHVEDYQRMIDSLQIEVHRLRKELADKETQLSVKSAEKPVDDELSWLNVLSQETSENVQERINLQRAMFELEETNVRNRIELQHLDDAIAKEQAIEKDGVVVQALRSRRQDILDNIRDNDESAACYQKVEIEANEKHRCQLHRMIEEAISNNGNRTYLRILSQYRLLGMANTELQFEMAMRDQVIHTQRESQRNLWNLIMGLGLDQKQIIEMAAKQGLTIEDSSPHRGAPTIKMSHAPGHGNSPHLWCSPGFRQSYSSTSIYQNQGFGCRLCSQGKCDSARTICREEHHRSYYMLAHDHSPSAYMGRSSEHWVNGRPGLCTPESSAQDVCHSYPEARIQSSQWNEEHTSNSAFRGDFGLQKGAWSANRHQLLHTPMVNESHEDTNNQGGATRALFGNRSSSSNTRRSYHV
ncbi:hypothetical protein IFM89_010005 [Coptis chinensis]|uniref:Kinesin-like protein n=1 Tax=Coptis chinensis TaxID=261450 RepID=A0A835LUD3_9MAGN|nr:hypothetical protein IFM89_010005 [Coptis chinensis]